MPSKIGLLCHENQEGFPTLWIVLTDGHFGFAERTRWSWQRIPLSVRSARTLNTVTSFLWGKCQYLYFGKQVSSYLAAYRHGSHSMLCYMTSVLEYSICRANMPNFMAVGIWFTMLGNSGCCWAGSWPDLTCSTLTLGFQWLKTSLYNSWCTINDICNSSRATYLRNTHSRFSQRRVAQALGTSLMLWKGLSSSWPKNSSIFQRNLY